MTIQEIALSWDSDLLEANLTLTDGDLTLEQGLYTSIIISLFTDKRAADDDVLPDPLNNDLRGWWGEIASPEVDGDQIGSKLWLLERSKATDNVIAISKEYIENSLQWMIEDEIASSIEVETEKQRVNETYILAFRVRIYLIQEITAGSNISAELFFTLYSTASSGSDPRTSYILTFDGTTDLTFDGIDSLSFSF